MCLYSTHRYVASIFIQAQVSVYTGAGKFWYLTLCNWTKSNTFSCNVKEVGQYGSSCYSLILFVLTQVIYL